MKSNHSFAPLVTFLVLAGFLVGCDSGKVSNHSPEVVVESYLVAGEELPSVWVHVSEDKDATYILEPLAVNDAQVVIQMLGEDGEVEASFPYERDEVESGAYKAEQSHIVKGGTTYRLEVDAGSSFELVTAETLVPTSFELIAPSAEAIEYKDPAQYSMLVTQSTYQERQGIFIFTMESQDPTIQNLIPTYFEFVFPDEDIEDLEGIEWSEEDFIDLLVFSSQPIFEGNYEVFSDNTLRVKLPWFAVPFYGPLKVTMHAIDDNLFDFQRYQLVQQGGSTLSPGEIPNVVDTIENGRGVFGSMSNVSHIVDILRPNE